MIPQLGETGKVSPCYCRVIARRLAKPLICVLLFLCLTCVSVVRSLAVPVQATQQPAPIAHFHHLHLNSTDPAAAIDFYTSKFDCEKARFAGLLDGVWAQKSWLLFTKVSSPPPWELTSAIWHFGWGAEDMKATYQKHLDMGPGSSRRLPTSATWREGRDSITPMWRVPTAR